MSYVKKYIKEYYNLGNNVLFNQMYDTGCAIFTFNKIMNNNFWNHAYPYNVLGGQEFQKFISDVISFYLSRKKDAVIYLDDKNFNNENLDILLKNKFERFDNEAWMSFKTYNKDKIPSFNLNIVKINTLKKFNSFKKVIDKCFKDNRSSEFKNTLFNIYGFKKIEHFCFYSKKQLVGVCSILFDKNVAQLNNVGVLPKYRGKGFGKAIVYQILKYVVEDLKIDLIFQCDGVSLESFYKKLGAETFYRRYGYKFKVKDD